MKLQLDIKSAIVGFIGAATLITALSFRNQENNELGRYTIHSSEVGTTILDTKTGNFIINFMQAHPANWFKGNFDTIFQEVKKK
jgi:hypothetical protein